jgi:hypothetical protein
VGRRIELALYLFPKSLEALWAFLLRRGWMRDIPHLEKLIMMVSIGILGIGCIEKKNYIKGTYNNMLKELWE